MAFGTTPSNSTEYAKYASSPSSKVRAALWGGRTRQYKSKLAAGTYAAGDQVNLFRLEPGQVVIDGFVKWKALGTSVQFWIGDAGDCDRYKTATNGAVASLDHTDATAGGDCTRFNAITGDGYEITSTTQDVILTFSYAAAPGARSLGDLVATILIGSE